MKSLIGSCVVCCLAVGCQKSSTDVADVENAQHLLFAVPVLVENVRGQIARVPQEGVLRYQRVYRR